MAAHPGIYVRFAEIHCYKEDGEIFDKEGRLKLPDDHESYWKGDFTEWLPVFRTSLTSAGSDHNLASRLRTCSEASLYWCQKGQEYRYRSWDCTNIETKPIDHKEPYWSNLTFERCDDPHGRILPLENSRGLHKIGYKLRLPILRFPIDHTWYHLLGPGYFDPAAGRSNGEPFSLAGSISVLLGLVAFGLGKDDIPNICRDHIGIDNFSFGQHNRRLPTLAYSRRHLDAQHHPFPIRKRRAMYIQVAYDESRHSWKEVEQWQDGLNNGDAGVGVLTSSPDGVRFPGVEW